MSVASDESGIRETVDHYVQGMRTVDRGQATGCGTEIVRPGYLCLSGERDVIK